MASMQDTLTKALRHLGDMTLSQRLAIMMGAALVVGSMGWMLQWAATSEMVPLLGQELSSDELAEVTAGLDAMNEPYTVEGSRVMVHGTASRQAILASLQQADRLPSDTAMGFAQLVKESNPWIPAKEHDRRWTVALQAELARVIGEFAGVKQARVLLNLTSKRGFSRSSPEATAGVTLFMQTGESVPRHLALATARLVSGAVQGLPLKNVQVVDGGTGRVALDWESEEDGSASSVDRRRHNLEREKEQQIKAQLSFDPKVLVSVSAELEYSAKRVQNLTVSEGATVKEESDTSNTVRGRREGQPGVEPNVGVTADGGSTSDQSTTEHTDRVSEPSRVTEATDTPAGVPKRITAAISISYSYLLSVFTHQNPDAEAPTEAQIEELFARQQPQIEAQVTKLVFPQDAKQVSVAWHYDVLDPEVEVQAGALDASLELAKRYGPASGLSLLSLVALAMMMKMAKQSGAAGSIESSIDFPPEAVAAARAAVARREPMSASVATASVAGGSAGGVPAAVAERRAVPAVPLEISDSAEGLLDAKEVDEASVQIKQMIEQVTQAADTDADGIASLVEKWIQGS